MNKRYPGYPRTWEMMKKQEEERNVMYRKKYEDISKRDLDIMRSEIMESLGPFGKDSQKMPLGSVSQLVAKLEKAVDEMQEKLKIISKENEELRAENYKLREAISIVERAKR
jgi:hypothetical protein